MKEAGDQPRDNSCIARCVRASDAERVCLTNDVAGSYAPELVIHRARVHAHIERHCPVDSGKTAEPGFRIPCLNIVHTGAVGNFNEGRSGPRLYETGALSVSCRL